MSKEQLKELLELHEKAVVAYEDCDFLEMRGYLETLFLEGFIDYLIEQAERVQELEGIKSEAIEQIDVTQERNKRLENRVQELEKELIYYKMATESYEEMESQNKRYRKALEFYANRDNYKEFYDVMRERKAMMIIEDGGRKAREALEVEG